MLVVVDNSEINIKLLFKTVDVGIYRAVTMAFYCYQITKVLNFCTELAVLILVVVTF